jgi:hypothetical protein
MDNQRVDRGNWARMSSIVEWIGAIVIPAALYLDWVGHGRLGWVDFALVFAWCSIVVRRIIELRRSKTAQDK